MRLLLLLALLLLSIPVRAAPPCERLVSLAPSITELVFELGLDQSLVGVTKFCAYPPAARNKAVVGGYLDPNLERILSLAPTTVIVTKEAAQLKGQLEKIGIGVRSFDHSSVKGIMASINELGQLCRVETRARTVSDSIRSAINRVQQEPPRKRRSVLVIVGRVYSAGRLSGLYVSGKDGFYTELLELAGSTNVHQTNTVAIPTISLEGLLSLNPDTVIEIQDDVGKTSEEYLRAWDTFSVLPAVRNRRVFIINDDYARVPGPRFPLLLRKIADILREES